MEPRTPSVKPDSACSSDAWYVVPLPKAQREPDDPSTIVNPCVTAAPADTHALGGGGPRLPRRMICAPDWAAMNSGRIARSRRTVVGDGLPAGNRAR